jgi:endoglucanase
MKAIIMSLLIGILIILSGCQWGSDDYLEDEYFTDMYNYDQTGILGRGINMGNFLESPLSQGGEGAWINGIHYPIQQQFFVKIREAGFKHVRIPIRWSDYTGSDTPYTIDPDFMDRIQEVVDWALDEELVAVINVHHYNEMMDDEDANDLAYHKARLHAIWAQICDVFTIGSYSVADLCFEPLNEPNNRVTYNEWNNIIADITELVWDTKGQTNRKLVIGTANWGGVGGLEQLVLPLSCTAGNTIITYHYYEPFQFTHQGAEWVSGSDAWLGTSWTATTAQRNEITNHFDQVVSWNENNGHFELWMGEFGAYNKTTNDMQQRAWTAFCTREAEKRHISWAYWEFCSGFGAYDWQTGSWRYHLLNGPLIPNED